MKTRRFDKLDPQRQQQLFDSAADEFAEHGYDAASLNRILENSKMSKSSLYYYFEDKADLFTTLTERSLGYLFREMGGFDIEALTAETYWLEIEKLFLRGMTVMNKNAWYVKLGRMFYRLRGKPTGRDKTGRIFIAARHWIGLTINHGQKLGVVRDDLPDSLLIDCTIGLGEAVDSWVLEHWDDLDKKARLGMVGEQTGLFKRLLAPTGPSS